MWHARMSQWLDTFTTTYCSCPPDPELVISVPADDLRLEYCSSQELRLSICSTVAIILRHVARDFGVNSRDRIMFERYGPLRIHLFQSISQEQGTLTVMASKTLLAIGVADLLGFCRQIVNISAILMALEVKPVNQYQAILVDVGVFSACTNSTRMRD